MRGVVWGVALVATLLGVALVLSTAGVAADGAVENASVEDDDSGSAYELEELRRGGSLVDGAAPSLRWLDDDGAVYIDYPNPNPLVLDVGAEWEADEILEPGELVEARTLTLHGQRDRGAGPAEYDLRVVYWTTERVEVEDDDGSTTTETRVADVTEESHEIEFSGSFDRSDIQLRHSGETRHVTMWLEDSDGEEISGARWTFRHRTAATTQAAGIDSMGDLFWWISKWIAGPLVFLTILGGFGSRAAIKRAGTGPDKGLLFWSVVLSVVSIFAVGLGWFYLADWVVALPLVIPVGLAAFMTLVVLETYESGVETVEFVRPELEFNKGPAGDLALDTLSVETSKEKVVRNGPEGLAVVRSGIRPFLARVFGGTAPLEGAGNLSTRVEVSGDEKEDAKVWIHPRAPHVLSYEPEGWTLSLPAPSDRDGWIRLAVVGVLTVAFAASIGWAWSPLWGVLAATLVVGIVALRPTSGFATVDVAPAHVREAFVSMLYLAREIDNADTISTARRKLVEKDARSEKDVEKALTERDETLVQEMHSVDPEDVVDNYDGDVEDLFEAATDGRDPQEVTGADD